MDTGDSGCGKERTAVAKVDVTQGSCVVCPQLVRTDSIGEGTPTADARARMRKATAGQRLRCKKRL